MVQTKDHPIVQCPDNAGSKLRMRGVPEGKTRPVAVGALRSADRSGSGHDRAKAVQSKFVWQRQMQRRTAQRSLRELVRRQDERRETGDGRWR